MAILKKRTSSRQLPDARGLERAPLDSVIRGVENTPFISDKGASSFTSSGGSNAPAGSGGRPFTSVFTNPATKPSLTTKTSSVPKTTLAPKTTLTSKTTPTVTNKTTTTPTTKTTTGTGAAKPTVKPKTTNTNSTTNKVVNALTGAAIGAGTKFLIDKITGKPNVAKTPAQIDAEKKALEASKSKDKAAAATAATAAAKAKAETEAKKKAEELKAKSGPTSVVKPPVINPATGKPAGTGFGDDKEEFTTDSLGNVYKTMPDGTSVLYRAAEVPEDEFTTDSLGNIYKTMPDGTSELYRAAEVPEDEFTTDSLGNVYKTMPDGTSELYRAAEVPEDEYMTDSLGNVYKTMPDGSYELYREADVPTNVEGTEFEPEYFEDSLGNVYISTADGGYDLYREAEVPEYAEDEYMTDSLGNMYKTMPDGSYELYRAAEVPEDIAEEDYNLFNPDYIDYDVNDRYSTEEDDGDEYYDYKRGGLITMMKQGGVLNMAGGGYLPEGAVDNNDGTYTIGNFTYDMETDEYLYSSDPDTGNISNVSPDAVYSTNPANDYYDTDSLGNIFKNGSLYLDAADVPTPIRSAGGGERPWYENIGSKLSKGFQDITGISDANLERLTGALPAAGAGALVASLLGSDFGGGTGNQNQGLDMSQVGVINPRTTDFGIGPTRFVGYEDYGTSDGDYTPNAELLKNLNAPGYNPVNEGDYGYEEVAAQEEAPKMASGGLSSMATPVASYYTFGQPADILANLGMRAQPPMNPPEAMPQIGQQQSPQQTQQQGLPQQAPPQMAQQMPQGMPQQGMMPQQQGMPPPMRKGGLPHVSDVPLTQGRMDFRKGAAVHGAGDGQSDDIPAMLADGEYVIDAETVAQIGNGSTKAGAQALDKFRESIRAHKRSAPVNKIPPKTKALTSYLKGAK
jgi:hypothetical protein